MDHRKPECPDILNTQSFAFIRTLKTASSQGNSSFTCPICGNDAWAHPSVNPIHGFRGGCKTCGFQIIL